MQSSVLMCSVQSVFQCSVQCRPVLPTVFPRCSSVMFSRVNICNTVYYCEGGGWEEVDYSTLLGVGGSGEEQD